MKHNGTEKELHQQPEATRCQYVAVNALRLRELSPTGTFHPRRPVQYVAEELMAVVKHCLDGSLGGQPPQTDGTLYTQYTVRWDGVSYTAPGPTGQMFHLVKWLEELWPVRLTENQLWYISWAV